MIRAIPWLLAIAACLAGSPAAAGTGADSSDAHGGAVARIVEHEGDVSLHHEGLVSRSESWSSLVDGDTVRIPADARARIVFATGEVVEKSGPAVVIVDVRGPDKECSLLGKLSMAARALIFGSHGQAGERPMAVRGRLTAELEPVAVPRLVQPYDGELLTNATVSFVWQPIVGVDIYRLSLYDPNGLVWQATTPGSHLEYAASAEKPLEPGREYYWRIEALLGESRLASWSSAFSVATSEYQDSILTAITELGGYTSSVVDKQMLAAEVLFAARLYGPALDAISAEGRGVPRTWIWKKAGLLSRLGDHTALEALMPTLLETTVSTPAEE